MKKMGIGLMGFGVVGQGVWQVLKKNNTLISQNAGVSLEVKKILVRDPEKYKNMQDAGPLFTTRWEDVIEDDSIHTVIELMGGTGTARRSMMAAMDAGKHVVTANKALLALHGAELTAHAREKGVQLRYEASVAGGIPVLHAIRESLSANRLESIMGIVNGTTNYILSRMTQEGITFETALHEAQKKGYAEADPTADVEAFDAAHKLTILASLGFGAGVTFQQVYREGIQSMTPVDIEYARELGYTIKLLAIARVINGGIELRVHPTMVPSGHPLAAVQDAYNAVYVKGNAVGELMFYGKGAGDLPTASAVLADVINVARNWDHPNAPSYPMDASDDHLVVQSMEDTMTAFYVRLLVKDVPGVLGRIATTFGSRGVSLLSVIQKGDEDPVSLVFVTHRTKESALQQAVEDIQSVDELVRVASIIRVEDI